MKKTHFGFSKIDENLKSSEVKKVFDSVAFRYDIMNDLMSFGLHRAWKRYLLWLAKVKKNDHVLDIASGTGDLALLFAKKIGPNGRVWHTDINYQMLEKGKRRLLDQGILLPSILCDAEQLPFHDASFDLISVAFGLRNMTHKELALKEMWRVLKPNSRLLILEFSQVHPFLKPVYDWYSFDILPRIGKIIAADAKSYEYLAESIRMHPDQSTLKEMVLHAGFAHVDVHNLTGGVVALHVGYKT